MKYRVYFLLVSIFLSLSLLAQDDKKVALTIGDEDVLLEELQRDYDNREISINENETFQEFLDSYILKKLILKEAAAKQVDALPAFKREYRINSIELLNSFIKDTVTARKLIEEIVQRFDYELELNHAFMPFEGELVFPKDTVDVYKKSLKQREVALKEGFEKVEKGVVINSYGVVYDATIQTGYIGWIQPMVFPIDIDEIIFSLPIGEITMPIRGKDGYHIFQVVDKRPARGNPVVEQVMFNFPVIPANRHIVDSVYNVALKTYNEIDKKGNFQEICDEFSAVFDTGDRGCLLGEIKIGEKIPVNIIQAAFDLQEIGEVSKPIWTEYGYHILRLKDKRPVPTKNQRLRQVVAMLQGPSAYAVLLKKERERLFAESNAELNMKPYLKLEKVAQNINPHDSLFVEKVDNRSDLLLSVDGKQYLVSDLLDYILANSWLYTKKDEESLSVVKYEPVISYSLSTDILKKYLDDFVASVLIGYKKEKIQQENAEYQMGIKQLTEGLMYTHLLNQEVWRKSEFDEVGLEAVFRKNKSKYKLAGEYFKGVVVHGKSKSVIDEIEKENLNRLPDVAVLRQKYNKDSIQIQVDRGLWKEGDNPFVDTKIYNVGNKEGRNNYPFYTVVGQFITSPLDFTDVISQVSLDYQQELHHELEETLKSKYKVKVNSSVIKEIK